MKRAGYRWKIFLGWVAILLSAPATAQHAKENKKAESGGISRAAESPAVSEGVRYQSSNRRDPFLNPNLGKKEEKQEDEEEVRGLPPPGIAGTYIEKAMLLGTASRDEKQVAVIRSSDNRAYFLVEGDRLFDGYVKNIGGDFVTLVRETKMKSGKILTQEVTKRLRTR